MLSKLLIFAAGFAALSTFAMLAKRTNKRYTNARHGKLLKTSDGSVYMFLDTYLTGNGAYNSGCVLKFDKDLNLLWQKAYTEWNGTSATSTFEMHGAAEYDTNTIVIYGYSWDLLKATVTMVNKSDGSVVWTTAVATIRPESIVVISGNIFIAGSTNNALNGVPFVVKLDGLGNVLNRVTYTKSSGTMNCIVSMSYSANDNCIYALSTGFDTSSRAETYVLKLGLDCSKIDVFQIGSISYEGIAVGIAALPSGGAIVVQSVTAPIAGYCYSIVKIDSSGVIQLNTYGQCKDSGILRSTLCKGLHVTPAGDIILSGITTQMSNVGYCWVGRIDSTTGQVKMIEHFFSPLKNHGQCWLTGNDEDSIYISPDENNAGNYFANIALMQTNAPFTKATTAFQYFPGEGLTQVSNLPITSASVNGTVTAANITNVVSTPMVRVNTSTISVTN